MIRVDSYASYGTPAGQYCLSIYTIYVRTKYRGAACRPADGMHMHATLRRTASLLASSYSMHIVHSGTVYHFSSRRTDQAMVGWMSWERAYHQNGSVSERAVHVPARPLRYGRHAFSEPSRQLARGNLDQLASVWSTADCTGYAYAMLWMNRGIAFAVNSPVPRSLVSKLIGKTGLAVFFLLPSITSGSGTVHNALRPATAASSSRPTINSGWRVCRWIGPAVQKGK
jgi:hypothetical protein